MTPRDTTTDRPHARTARRPQPREATDALASHRARDEYAELVRCHQDAMYRYALRRLRSEHEAQDVTQEALLAGWRFRHQRDPDVPARAWFLRITHNKLVDHLRRRRDELLVGDTCEQRELSSRDFAGLLCERQRLIAALARLSPEFRSVALLRLVRGLSEAETCQQLGLPLGTVKTRLHRARRDLAGLLDEAPQAA
jgi:RNA polymerase sigma-70 factor (ECF subfamily)